MRGWDLAASSLAPKRMCALRSLEWTPTRAWYRRLLWTTLQALITMGTMQPHWLGFSTSVLSSGVENASQVANPNISKGTQTYRLRSV